MHNRQTGAGVRCPGRSAAEYGFMTMAAGGDNPGSKKKKSVPRVVKKTGAGKEKPEQKTTAEPIPERAEQRNNIRCRRCLLIDGYRRTEKACHYCGSDIYEIDFV